MQSLDGSVNTTDFTILAANFNKTGQNWLGGDFNGDGRVNALDFNLLASDFGQTDLSSPPLGTLVPEPSVAIVVGLMGVGAMPRRRRNEGLRRL